MAQEALEVQVNKKFLHLADDCYWDLLTPNVKAIPLHGVQVVEYFPRSIIYEAIVFEDLSKVVRYNSIHIVSETLAFDESTYAPIFRITDTAIRFALDEFYDPNILDFELVFTKRE